MNPKLTDQQDDLGQIKRKRIDASFEENYHERGYNSCNEELREENKLISELSESDKSEPDLHEIQNTHFVELRVQQ